jgi:ribosome maturation factor RimP
MIETRGRMSPLFVNMIQKKTIQALAEERINELNKGLFIVEIRISSASVIHVELDKYDGNVSVEDCVSVSRNIEHNLDREQEDFELHVSSAGLDKPLRVLPQYEKNIGREVSLKLDDNSKLEGVLTKVNADELSIERQVKVQIEGKKKKELITEELTFPFAKIKETKIVISFK